MNTSDSNGVNSAGNSKSDKSAKAGRKSTTVFQTSSEIPIKECYGTEDLPADLAANLGNPGQFPFTRGVQPNMYRGRPWTMRQYAGFATAEESNKRYHYLLSQGTTGLSVAFDLPTQLGYDPDHPKAHGEVGKVGVSIATIEDMETLFRGIDLSKVSTSMTINATANILLGLYTTVAAKSGHSSQVLRGTVQNDILKEYIARGNFIYPPLGAMRLTTDLFAWCAEHSPKWNVISISGYHIREAGSTAVQELAFTFANGIAYVEAALKAGLKIDHFGPQLSFFFNVHNDFFEEVAKFRAARRIWARIMRDRFKALDPKSMMVRFHSQTAGSTLAAQQPENNVVRVTMQALASVLGGTQSLHTNALDEALGLPTEQTARTALRTQQIIAHESNVTATVDPLAGSYFVERLTSEIETKVLAYIADIEKRGGTIACIETGFIQNEILNSAYRDQIALERKTRIQVGVNEFADQTGSESSAGASGVGGGNSAGVELSSTGAASSSVSSSGRAILKISGDVERDAIARIQAFKKKRSASQVDQALKAVAFAADNGSNLQVVITSAMASGATLGEVSDVLRGKFGEYREYSKF